MPSANPDMEQQPAEVQKAIREALKKSEKKVKKLVLCFDGTGNVFSGSTADTNVVKIYDKLDRDADEQYHYYQTGIGTYDISGGSMNKSWLGSIQSSISATLDQGFATTFDAHVIAGYRFVMRYYDSGDKIYMFGFSRGAFTARFLARMINTVGLLSKGNEEMVPFAYQLYQRYEMGKIKDKKFAEAEVDVQAPNLSQHPNISQQHLIPKSKVEESDIEESDEEEVEETLSDENESPGTLPEDDRSQRYRSEELQKRRNELHAFSSTFCRRERKPGQKKRDATGVKVYFLGLFDCVSSVKTLEAPSKDKTPVTVLGTAEHVRHAVAIDERRVKFRAALLAQDISDPRAQKEDIKEVWFPGNHGDVGGGWPAPTPPPKKGTSEVKVSWWQRFKYWLRGSKAGEAAESVKHDPYQMSDVALHWMIHELKELGKKDKDAALKWNKDRLKGFERHFNKFKESQAFKAKAHDTMTFGGGCDITKVLFWKFMEMLPFMVRAELKNNKWTTESRWPNMGGTRDIPAGAVFHHSVLHRLASGKEHNYKPANNRGDTGKALLVDPDVLMENPDTETYKVDKRKHHQTYILKADEDFVRAKMNETATNPIPNGT